MTVGKLEEKKQYIDGLDNVDYWTGQSETSARNHIFYYNESNMSAVRMGPWKWHFTTTEDYYGNITGRSKPLVINIRTLNLLSSLSFTPHSSFFHSLL